jgi:hypothetical protein
MDLMEMLEFEMAILDEHIIELDEYTILIFLVLYYKLLG